jgi:hypothetical protein
VDENKWEEHEVHDFTVINQWYLCGESQITFSFTYKYKHTQNLPSRNMQNNNSGKKRKLYNKINKIELYFIFFLNKYCGVFMPCKNCNIETPSRDYAIVDEAVFSPCRAEQSRSELRKAEPIQAVNKSLFASHRLTSCCQATAINTWMMQE